MRVRLTIAICTALATSVSAQGIGLAELAEIARARAARQRPALVAALEPFVADLALAYQGRNRSYLDAKFDEIAKLGSGIVPLLLEYLTPTNAGEDAQNRADNVARVLARLGPAEYVDHLVELTRHTSETARRNAIWLLGFTASQRAEIALVDRISALADPERIQ
ncbi:MAG: HEAT repeat domain-containing protein, partial [Planctomycetes bacterium]|nr:HEAT repeat domain-containing protein [Planctomycetota bacterium]